ncbi:UDP-4-amino-4,6-dideoxy-N-acetyl-beta-L-altrosami ne transaminase [Caminibacter profundus]
MIPYGKQYIDETDKKAVLEVLENDFLTTGPNVKEFEEELCKYTGAKYAVAVSNGTAALHIASLILLEKGDLVLTTPNSFLATSNSILYAGAKPIFVDIKKNGNIDLDKCIEILEKFRGKIKALYVVHFSGNPVDMEKLKYIKENFNIKILEDAAHAIGAKYSSQVPSSKFQIGNCQYSDITTFSFHPVKNITTGEGGAILTNDEEIYKKALIIRNHGIVRPSNHESSKFQNKELAIDEKGNINPWYYEMQELGFNYRITDIQCALGLSQLKKLDTFIKKRQALAKKYDKAFENTLIKPLYKFNENSAYHLYVVRADFSKLKLTKAELFYKMRNLGIGLQLHYIPINKQPYYQKLGYGSEHLPEMYKYYKEAFSIPLYPALSIDEQNYVIEKLFEVLK